jgi:uncharacterized protein YqjF (DUF2071 family)
MVSPAPEQRVRFPAVQQRWRAVTFLHVRYPPEVVARHLPPDLEPDTFDGDAWVGITPFRMWSSVLPVAPGPRVGLGEVNVRTYVRDRAGRDALWFLSLDLDNAAVAAALRASTRVPYRWADVAIERRGSRLSYAVSRHRPQRPASLTLEVEAGTGGTVAAGPLETFLTGRWRAFTRVLGRTFAVPVEHEPWPLRSARLLRWDGDLLAAAGLPEPEGDPHLLFSPGVDVRLGWPRPIGSVRP